jgi:hypothetical protein
VSYSSQLRYGTGYEGTYATGTVPLYKKYAFSVVPCVDKTIPVPTRQGWISRHEKNVKHVRAGERGRRGGRAGRERG